MSIFLSISINCFHVSVFTVLQEGVSALTTGQVSMVTAAHHSPTPQSTMVTSVKTALHTLRRLTPLSHSRRRRRHHHYRHHLRWQKRPQTSYAPPQCHHSQVYTPERGVEETRQVSWRFGVLLHVKFLGPGRF